MDKMSSPLKSPISPNPDFLIPSPIPTKRSRTISQSEVAAMGPSFFGQILEFCREKGHGFIKPKDENDKIFVHISDIECDYIPKPGDDVQYKKCLVPPKNEKYSAIHVKIVHPVEGIKHETWDAPAHLATK